MSQTFDTLLANAQAALAFTTHGWLDDSLTSAWAMAATLMGRRPGDDAQSMAVMTSILLTGRWAVSGFPVLEPTHRLAASLMATNLSEGDAAEDLRCPFPGVVVRLPTKLLFIEHEGEPVEASFLQFCEYEKDGKRVWSYSLASVPVPRSEDPGPRENGISIWACHVPHAALCNNRLPDEPTDWSSLEKTKLDERTEELTRKLIIGLCLWCSDKQNLGVAKRSVPKTQKRASRSSILGRGSILPSFQRFELGRGIELDMKVVDAVRAYNLEGGRSPKVQSLVCGHWKLQAHGPRMTLRKRIHIKAYWRGPLDAPVLTHRGQG